MTKDEMPLDPFDPAEVDKVFREEVLESGGNVKYTTPGELFGDRISPLLFLAAAAIVKTGGVLVLTPEDMAKHLKLAIDIVHYRETGNIRVYAFEEEK